MLGFLLAYEGRAAESVAAFEAALALDPNHADAWIVRADLSVLNGRPEDALAQLQKALRLNPHPPPRYCWITGSALHAARRYERAAAALRHEATYRTGSRRILAASLAQLGRMDEARQEAELFMIGNPRFTIGRWAAVHGNDPATCAHFVDGYRKAGLPEQLASILEAR